MSKDLKFSVLDNPIDQFLGENDLPSNQIFEYRKDYKDFALKGYRSPIKHLDLWYEKPLYGKVNKLGDPMWASESNLKQINSKDETVLALDFIVDAFHDFKSHIEQGLIQQKIKRSGQLSDFSPTRGWISVNTLHHDHMDLIYNLFVSFFANKNKKIINFSSFIDEFLIFVRGIIKEVPITRSAFIKSRQCPITISGLAIEFSDLSHSDDSEKMTQYLRDKNFEFYINALKLHGFVIDKNAPFRIIGDISSVQMQRYMEKYGITFNPGTATDLFELYYYSAKLEGYDIFKEYMLHIYNSLVEAYPFVKKTKICNTTKTLLSKIKHRMPVDTVEHVREEEWMRFYFHMRALEEKTHINQRHIAQVIQLQKIVDLEHALEYIEASVTHW